MSDLPRSGLRHQNLGETSPTADVTPLEYTKRLGFPRPQRSVGALRERRLGIFQPASSTNDLFSWWSSMDFPYLCWFSGEKHQQMIRTFHQTKHGFSWPSWNWWFFWVTNSLGIEPVDDWDLWGWGQFPKQYSIFSQIRAHPGLSHSPSISAAVGEFVQIFCQVLWCWAEMIEFSPFWRVQKMAGLASLAGRVAMVWLVPAVPTARLRLPESQAVEHCFDRCLDIYLLLYWVSETKNLGDATFARCTSSKLTS